MTDYGECVYCTRDALWVNGTCARHVPAQLAYLARKLARYVRGTARD